MVSTHGGGLVGSLEVNLEVKQEKWWWGLEVNLEVKQEKWWWDG